MKCINTAVPENPYIPRLDVTSNVIENFQIGSPNSISTESNKRKESWVLRTARRASPANNIELDSCLSIETFYKNASSPLFPLPAISIRYQHSETLLQSAATVFAAMATMSRDGVPFCCFCLALSHPLTQYPAGARQLQTTLIDKCNKNLRRYLDCVDDPSRTSTTTVQG